MVKDILMTSLPQFLWGVVKYMVWVAIIAGVARLYIFWLGDNDWKIKTFNRALVWLIAGFVIGLILGIIIVPETILDNRDEAVYFGFLLGSGKILSIFCAIISAIKN